MAITAQASVNTGTQAGKTKMTYLLLIAFSAAMGGYLFGFDFAVISGALPFLREQFGLTEYWEGFATGSLALGAIIGCVLAGKLADVYGRKKTLLCAALIFMVSSLGMAFSPNLSFFIAARFIAGAGVGMASMISPMYIAEVSPAKYRGRMVAVNQLTIVIGILLTNLINYSLRNNGDDAWRWMFGLGVIPSAVFVLGVFILPESPYWLIQKKEETKALNVLKKTAGTEYADETLSAIKNSFTEHKKTKLAELFQKQWIPFVIIGVVLAVFQQFCGINVVFNYTSNIFEAIGANKDDQLLQTVFIGVVNLLFTLLAMALVDKLGRKPLMLIGSIGLAVLYIATALLLQSKSASVAYVLLTAIGVYAVSLAPVTWVLIAEIFPSRIRSAGISFSVLCLWAAYFILTFTFPVLAKNVGMHNTFFIYSFICVVGFIFIIRKVPETKGKSLEQIEQELSK
ncbi:MAG: sugar porter family MFS transporter [Bacteroidota bacterium]|nr:sugar porter family MFS transporter [Bacteroidota bacterium]